MLTHLNPSSVPPSRVVILGAHGFIARALAIKLTVSKIPVLAISSQELDLTLPTAGQILAAQLQSTDAVVMTAGLTPDKGRDTATLIRNLCMAEQVVNAVALQPCAHLIYFSSDAVYDSRHPDVSESTPAAPSDLYGVMHLARELALAQVTTQQRIPFCILRPCAIYGAGDTHNSYGPNRFLRTALTEGKIKLFGAGEETRDHVCIDDVIELTVQALHHLSSGTLNLVSGQCVTFAQLAAKINHLLGGSITIESLPRSGSVTHRRFDTDSLRQAFPAHTAIPLDTGLAQTISELRRNQA
ncbi:MAG: NAD(P)-dependent oxidoreductase [Verrucomicrobia bacterium]|nr:NAD(P)-dependent oxidoreductase [Verrucomicrobiota bacterium]